MDSEGVVLVTGGAGYIGSHCIKELLKRNLSVVAYDNLVEGHREMVLCDDFVEGDLGNKSLLEETFERFPVKAVMHFAAHCKVGESVQNPHKYYQNNVVNGLNLLQTMIEYGTDKLVFSSSAAVYGDPEEVPIMEDHPKNPKNPYGRTKWIFESLLGDYVRAYNLNAISLRYFNAAGSDPRGKIGELHCPETHLIPIVLEAATEKREYVEIFGTDYPTPDGTCIRDFIHVNDLARAHIKALNRLKNGSESGVNEAYNLGIGRGYSVREVIDTCRSVTNKPIKSVDGQRRAGDPPRLVAESSKVRTDLEWEPKYNDLTAIVETAWNWMQQRSERKKV